MKKLFLSVTAILFVFATQAQLSFTAMPPIVSSHMPSAISTGDLNNDNYLDLAWTNYSGQQVCVNLGFGDGTFGPTNCFAIDLPTYKGDATTVKIIDMNNDNKLDLVVSHENSRVGIFQGKGDGTFEMVNSFAVAGPTCETAIADFNNDGKLDVASCDFYASKVSVLSGNGDCTLGTATSVTSAGNDPHALAAGDFDGDGNIDLFVANYSTSNGYFSWGDGTGEALFNSYSAVGSQPWQCVAADFNKDGYDDIALTCLNSNYVQIMHGHSERNIIRKQVSTQFAPQGIALADFNKDGYADIVCVNSAAASFSVILNNHDGTYATAKHYSCEQGPRCIATADVNNDGFQDVIISTYTAASEETIIVWLGSYTTTGISHASKAGIVVYPNPAQSQLNIETDMHITKIELLDIYGVIHITSNSYPVSLNSLSKGMYTVRLYSEEGSYTEQIVVE